MKSFSKPNRDPIERVIAVTDVALIDIHMPGADGLSLARALTGLAAPPAVVFVTAHAEHAGRNRVRPKRLHPRDSSCS